MQGVGYKNTLHPCKTGNRTPIPKPKEWKNGRQVKNFSFFAYL